MEQRSLLPTRSLTMQLGAACFILMAWSAQAQIKVKVNTTMTSPALDGLQIGMSPYEMPENCTDLGVCVPYNFTLPPATLWTWCGWTTSKRTDYLISASGTITAALMSTHYLNECALPSLPDMSSCYTVFGSSCTGNNCTTRVSGLAFVREACLVIANSGTKPVKLGVQVFQYHDSPRYYGVIFSIILAIIIFGGMAANVIWTLYSEITSPPDRIHELRSLENQLEHTETNSGSASTVDLMIHDRASDHSDPGSFQGRVKVALTKAKNLVMRNKGANQQ